MKELLVVMGLTFLGCIIALLILGSGDNGGLLGASKNLFENQVNYLGD